MDENENLYWEMYQNNYSPIALDFAYCDQDTFFSNRSRSVLHSVSGSDLNLTHFQNVQISEIDIRRPILSNSSTPNPRIVSDSPAGNCLVPAFKNLDFNKKSFCGTNRMLAEHQIGGHFGRNVRTLVPINNQSSNEQFNRTDHELNRIENVIANPHNNDLSSDDENAMDVSNPKHEHLSSAVDPLALEARLQFLKETLEESDRLSNPQLYTLQ
ncbi:hypothetical protein BB559_004828 [Furculomyces boomerangus]|uniref:Uncharacterized protein n=1 Tax=Furculomyces boomerangus TaxID=61424 RepID=A0A2T9YCF5_9FUNG|nr:hypothetical protein BB559_004828 [Furculomyces boomerangus]